MGYIRANKPTVFFMGGPQFDDPGAYSNGNSSWHNGNGISLELWQSNPDLNAYMNPGGEAIHIFDDLNTPEVTINYNNTTGVISGWAAAGYSLDPRIVPGFLARARHIGDGKYSNCWTEILDVAQDGSSITIEPGRATEDCQVYLYLGGALKTLYGAIKIAGETPTDWQSLLAEGKAYDRFVLVNKNDDTECMLNWIWQESGCNDQNKHLHIIGFHSRPPSNGSMTDGDMDPGGDYYVSADQMHLPVKQDFLVTMTGEYNDQHWFKTDVSNMGALRFRNVRFNGSGMGATYKLLYGSIYDVHFDHCYLEDIPNYGSAVWSGFSNCQFYIAGTGNWPSFSDYGLFINYSNVFRTDSTTGAPNIGAIPWINAVFWCDNESLGNFGIYDSEYYSGKLINCTFRNYRCGLWQSWAYPVLAINNLFLGPSDDPDSYFVRCQPGFFGSVMLNNIATTDNGTFTGEVYKTDGSENYSTSIELEKITIDDHLTPYSVDIIAGGCVDVTGKPTTVGAVMPLESNNRGIFNISCGSKGSLG